MEPINMTGKYIATDLVGVNWWDFGVIILGSVVMFVLCLAAIVLIFLTLNKIWETNSIAREARDKMNVGRKIK